MMKNLLICQTPFQLILARSILGGRNDYDLLLILEKNSNYEKIEHYVRYFVDNNIDVKCLEINNSGIFSLKSLFCINLFLKNNLDKEYNHIYFSSIHNLYIQLIISIVRFKQINTFDDGIGNINKEGVFYSDYLSLKSKIIRYFFKIKFDINKIKKQTKSHYTIYKGIDNIVENCTYVDLFGGVDTNAIDKYEEVSIFIGQPLEAIDTDIDYTCLKDFMSKKGISLYYPHPRENLNVEFNKITSPLIAEEYIINFLRENPNLKINVYGFFSSVLFNVISIHRIKVYALSDNLMSKKYSFLYSMLNDMGGIVLNIEDSI